MNTRRNYNSETPLQSALAAKTLLPKALAELVTQSEKKRSVFRNAEVKLLYDSIVNTTGVHGSVRNRETVQTGHRFGFTVGFFFSNWSVGFESSKP